MSWFLVALMVVCSALVFTFTRAPGDRMLADLLRRTALPLIPAVQPRLRRRMRHRGAGVAFGALAGAAITAVVLLLEPDAFGGWPWTSPSSAVESPFAPLLCTAIFIACISIGAAAAAFEPFSTVTPDAVRIARATTPQLADYMSEVWRWLPRGFVAAALLGYSGSLIWPGAASAERPAATLAPIFLATSLLAVVATELVSTRLLRAPQPAAGPEELAWDDALRAQALRELWMAPLALSTTATVCVIGLIAPVELMFLLTVPIGFVPLISMIGNPGSRFHGLWAMTELSAATSDPAQASVPVEEAR